MYNLLKRYFSSPPTAGDLQQIPEDVLINEILLKMDYNTLNRVCNSNTATQSICQRTDIWRKKLNLDFVDRDLLLELDLGMTYQELYRYYSTTPNLPVYIASSIIGYIRYYIDMPLFQLNAQVRRLYDDYYRNTRYANTSVLAAYYTDQYEVADVVYLRKNGNNVSISEYADSLYQVVLYPQSDTAMDILYRLFVCIYNAERSMGYFTNHKCQINDKTYNINRRNVNLYKLQLYYLLKIFSPKYIESNWQLLDAGRLRRLLVNNDDNVLSKLGIDLDKFSDEWLLVE